MIQAVAANSEGVNINGTLLHTSDIPIKYCSPKPIKNLDVFRIKGTVAYDPETNLRTEPESVDEVAWGNYRILMKEYKLENVSRQETE